MSVLDNGGFDVLLEVSQSAAAGLLRSRVSIPDRTQPFSSNGITGDATIHVTPSNARFTPGNRLGMDFALAGSTLALTAWPLPVQLPTVDNVVNLDATVAVGDLVQAAALSAVVNTAPDPANATPSVAVTLDRNAILASAPVTILLGYIVVSSGEAAMLAARAGILATLQTEIEAIVRTTLLATPIVQTLVAVPPMLAPPPTPPTRNPVRVDTTVGSLRVGALLGATTGNLNLITRSALRTSSTAGTAIDALSLVISNSCLLRDVARPIIAPLLGLTPGGFVAGDPFLWTGTATTTVGAAPATITFANVFINESGQLVVVFSFMISALAGAITIFGTATIAVNVGITTAGPAIVVTLTPQAPVISGARIDIAWWVYLLSALTLGTHGLVAIAVADAILDGTVSGGALSIPPFTVAVPVPSGIPPLLVTGVRLFQGDAPRRMLSSPPRPALGRDHDLIATFALS